jgi:pseudouridine-5'-phosphate glycosidase
VTPYLLKRVSELTGKASLTANLGLLLNNARVAAQTAVELAKIR